MNGWFKFDRAQAAIYALAVFALLALGVWRAESLYVERSRVIDGTKAQAAGIAMGMATYADRTIDVAELLADQVRDHVAAQGGLGHESTAELRSFLAAKAAQTTMQDFLMVVDGTGRPVALSERTAPPGMNFSDRDWFRAIRAGADDYIGAAIRGRLQGQIVYTYSKRLDPAKGVAGGIVDVAILPPSVKDPSQRLSGQPQSQVWTASGRLIVGSFMTFDARGNPRAMKPPFSTVLHKGHGFLKSDNHDRIIAYHRAGERALIATVSFSRKEILEPWMRRVWLSVGLFAGLAVGIGILVHLAASASAHNRRARRDLQNTANELSLALKQRDTLLREIHHRVKNNLQVTSSLMEMQAQQFGDEAVRTAFKRTQQRLLAIGMVHDVLYGEQGVSIVDMREYLSRLCTEIARANGTDQRRIRVAVSVDPIVLKAEQATSLGLCVSEVLVNAFKHAFPQSGGGVVSIALHEIEGHAELTIHDNGNGIAPADERKSLGMRLIKAFATQIGGTYSFDHEGGTTFRMTFAPAKPETAEARG